MKTARDSAPRWIHPNLCKVSYLPPKHNAKLLKLIGKRCLVQCLLDNIPMSVLWDTEAQASLVNEAWRSQYLPHTTIRPVEELLGHDTLTGMAANQTVIPFTGWIEVEFRLSSEAGPSQSFQVPILVSSDPKVAEDPIIGYNVIEEVIKGQMKRQRTAPDENTARVVSGAFAIDPKIAKTLIHVMHSCHSDSEGGVVKTGRRRTVLPPGQATTVRCCTHLGQMGKETVMLFVPEEKSQWPEGLQINEVLITVSKGNSFRVPISVVNTTSHSVTLDQRTTLGHVQPVKAVYPAAVQPVEGLPRPPDQNRTNLQAPGGLPRHPTEATEQLSTGTTKHNHVWDPPIKLDHLKEEQQAVVKKMLREECHAFCETIRTWAAFHH